MSKQQKLSERLRTAYDEDDMVMHAWDDRDELKGKDIIEAIKALEAENELLKAELKTLNGLCDDVQQQRDALRAERNALRDELAKVRNNWQTMYPAAIRERDEARAGYTKHFENYLHVLGERDAALAKLEKLREFCEECLAEKTTTEFSRGFDTACNHVLAILNQDTPVSHSKPESAQENTAHPVTEPRTTLMRPRQQSGIVVREAQLLLNEAQNESFVVTIDRVPNNARLLGVRSFDEGLLKLDFLVHDCSDPRRFTHQYVFVCVNSGAFHHDSYGHALDVDRRIVCDLMGERYYVFPFYAHLA